MKRPDAILAALLSLSLAGCSLRGKPRASKVPPPPQPVQTVSAPPPPRQLSIPQTQAELPPPQPVSPSALATAPPAEPVPEAPPPQRPPRRPAGPVAPPQPRQETPAPVAAAPERPPIEEIVPAETLKRLQESAQAHKREVGQLLLQMQSQRLNRQQAALIKRIQQFVKLSDDAEKNGSMREANEFADRALVLARELQSAR